jgi:membrane fusion protein (multidrug efflux system)
MARRSRKGLFFTISAIVIAVVIGGYFVTRIQISRRAAAADSTSDSTAVASGEGTKKDSKKDKKDKKKEPDPVPVEVSAVRPRQISSYYYATATLEPERTVQVLAKMTGEVEKLLVEEGVVVRNGQELCKLEDHEQKIALDEARINRDKQKREFERIEKMHEQNIISDREFSDAKYQYELAENQLSAAELKYEYTSIRAPFDGIVTKRFIERGQTVSPGTPLFEIADTDPLLVRMYLPEAEVRDIAVGQDVSIRLDSSPDVSYTGTIVRIAPEVDDRTGTVKVTAQTHGQGLPGSFARIKIVTDTRQGSLTIPRRGLISDAGDVYVYVAEADTVRRASVKVGYQDEEFAEVIDGVTDGDTVVVVGMGGLRTGTKVKVLDPTMQGELSRQGEKTDAKPSSN